MQQCQCHRNRLLDNDKYFSDAARRCLRKRTCCGGKDQHRSDEKLECGGSHGEGMGGRQNLKGLWVKSAVEQ